MHSFFHLFVFCFSFVFGPAGVVRFVSFPKAVGYAEPL